MSLDRPEAVCGDLTREKMWGERDTDLKLSALREALIELIRDVGGLNERHYRLEGRFQYHDHAFGRVMQQLETSIPSFVSYDRVPMSLKTSERDV